MKEELIEAFVDMEEAGALEIANAMLDNGVDPLEVLDACRMALVAIGERFGRGEAFVPELIMAGEMMNAIGAVVKPRLTTEGDVKKHGIVVIGTVEGDIHDIGKDIVGFMLDVNGFEVVDLGVDVPPEVFVEKIKETGTKVVGLSGLLTLAFESMKKTVDAITEAGLRDQVKIMLGGAPVDEHVVRLARADAWGKDAMQAVALAQEWIGG